MSNTNTMTEKSEEALSNRNDNGGKSRLQRVAQHVSPYLPSASFITLHYVYFIATCLLSSIIFWGSSTPAKSVRYIDSIFLTVSAMTEAGLNTVNLSTLNTWQQIILFLLIMMGSAIFVSSAVIHVRKRAFEVKLQELADRRQRRMRRLPLISSLSRSKRRDNAMRQREAAIVSGAIRGRAIRDPLPDQPYVPSFTPPVQTTEDVTTNSENRQTGPEAPTANAATHHIQFVDDERSEPSHAMNSVYRRSNRRMFSNTGVGAHDGDNHPRFSSAITEDDFDAAAAMEEAVVNDEEHDVPWPGVDKHFKLHKYVDTVNGYLGRNSQFHHLTEKERRALGGIEYDALCILSWIVPLYFILFQLCGALGCGAWMQVNMASTAVENGLNPFWTGAFFAISAFNNSGMALLDANATAFQRSYYMLLTLSLLILAGNTCFPPFLRLILWAIKKCTPDKAEWHTFKLTMQFILDHPRRVYTNLFPSDATWWLVLSLVVLNGIDWFAFEVLNIGNPVTQAIEPRFRVIDGLFQAFAVRCGGFYVVDIAGLYPGTLVLYVLMMYLSAYPVTMTIRNTNVYEERSLAIFAGDEPALPPQNLHEANILPTLQRVGTGVVQKVMSRTPTIRPPQAGQTARHAWSNQDFIRQQLQSQLGHDLWWLSLAVLFITIIETGHFLGDPVNFSVFNILFEVVSAYGTVGLSVGVPWNAYSFSGAWQTGSKLILCAVMLRGRHRGLPVAIDRAVLLPDNTLGWAEEEDGRIRRNRTGSFRALSRASTMQSQIRNPDKKAVDPKGSDAV